MTDSSAPNVSPQATGATSSSHVVSTKWAPPNWQDMTQPVVSDR